MTPHETLYKHRQLIDLIINHSYVPQRSAADFNEVLGALRQIDPKAHYDTSCSGCMGEIARMANVHLQEFIKQPKFHSFPDHKKK